MVFNATYVDRRSRRRQVVHLEKPVKIVAIGPEVAQYIRQGGAATARRNKEPK